MEIPSNITSSTVDPVSILHKVENLSQGRRQAIIFGIVGVVAFTSYGAVNLHWSRRSRRIQRDLELQEYNDYRKLCHNAELQVIGAKREILTRELSRLPGPVRVHETAGALANIGEMLEMVSTNMTYIKRPSQQQNGNSFEPTLPFESRNP
ncbi:hypothetical protein KGF57_001700, partial [Candida theae]